MNIDKLSDKAERYALSDEKIEQSEKDRLSFVNQFPLNELKALSID